MNANGPPQPATPAVSKLNHANEQTWLLLGNVAENMQDYERAQSAYEAALRHNSCSLQALSSIAALCRLRENFPKAVSYFQRILDIEPTNGEIWGALGHCYLMMDDLTKAYGAYQQALYHLPNPKEPKLWYGIGILYDRYGSLDHAEEAFSQVMRMDPKFEKANEIYFRLGIIYKQQQKYEQSLECFKYILPNPPRPLTEVDIWFQIGNVYDLQKNYQAAKDAYERVLAENPNHAKVLQQLGWLFHQQSANFSNQDMAISYLTKSIESDNTEAQSWYLLGRCYMAQQKYNKAYEAYQQAVYRDGRNPTFWCSIGVLYYQINQFRDALDAYSRAIRLNPYISEVWYDLGTLYESCNNQINDALDAYQRAAELDPANPHIKQRLQMLRNQQPQGGQTTAPVPQDVNPTAYQSQNPSMVGNPNYPQPGPGLQGPPAMSYGNRVVDQRSSHPAPPPLMNFPEHGPSNGRELPPMNDRRSPVSASSMGYLAPPPHLRGEPTTPPNQHTLNPVMQPPHDVRQLPHPPHPPPLRHTGTDKRQSPSPQLSQMPDDRRPRYSPQPSDPRPTYTSSPPMTTPEQHGGYHPPSHMELAHPQAVVDRREPGEMYDPTKIKSDDPVMRHTNGLPPPSFHGSEPHSSVHEAQPPHHPHHHDYREQQDKPSESQGGPSGMDRPSILNPPHQSPHQPPPPPMDLGGHRMHAGEGSVDDKAIPPIQYRPDEQQGRRNRSPSASMHLPEIKQQPNESSPPQPRPQESPVREHTPTFGSDPVSGISTNDELPRKSPTEQQPSRGSPDLSREPPSGVMMSEESSTAHSPTEARPNTLARIIDSVPTTTPTSPRDADNGKPVLPSMRAGPPSSERSSAPSSSRHVDEDYDGSGSAVDALMSMSSETPVAAPSSASSASSAGAGQKRPYSSPKEEGEEERSRDEGSPKRSKTSAGSPRGDDLHSSMGSTGQERERDRDHERERDRESRERDRDRDREPRERDRDRDRESRERDRDRDRDRDRGRDRDRELRDRTRDRDRSRDHDRSDRDRQRDRDRSRDRDRDREHRERERDREHREHRERERDRELRERERERERRKSEQSANSSSGTP